MNKRSQKIAKKRQRLIMKEHWLSSTSLSGKEEYDVITMESSGIYRKIAMNMRSTIVK